MDLRHSQLRCVRSMSGAVEELRAESVFVAFPDPCMRRPCDHVHSWCSTSAQTTGVLRGSFELQGTQAPGARPPDISAACGVPKASRVLRATRAPLPEPGPRLRASDTSLMLPVRRPGCCTAAALGNSPAPRRSLSSSSASSPHYTRTRAGVSSIRAASAYRDLNVR